MEFKLSKFQTAALITDVANGMSKAEAGRKYGISNRTVHRIFERISRDTRYDKHKKKLHPCGTIGAYRRHLRNGERCVKCCEANSKYENERIQGVKARSSDLAR